MHNYYYLLCDSYWYSPRLPFLSWFRSKCFTTNLCFVVQTWFNNSICNVTLPKMPHYWFFCDSLQYGAQLLFVLWFRSKRFTTPDYIVTQTWLNTSVCIVTQIKMTHNIILYYIILYYIILYYIILYYIILYYIILYYIILYY